MKTINYINRNIQRYMDKVVRDPETDCWEWVGSVNRFGYGQFHDHNRGGTVSAYRFSYEYFIGPVPPNLHLDHLCSNRICCNPRHLEPVIPAENIHRSFLRFGRKKKQPLKVCRQGHEFTPENTRFVATTGKQVCKTCSMMNTRNYRTRKKIRKN